VNADYASLPTPVIVVDRSALRANLEILARVRREAQCTILLALKGFAMFSVFDLVSQYLDGICASGPDEARLGAEHFGKQVHVYAPAYSESDIGEVARHADHVIFNSFAQWRRFGPRLAASPRPIECGLRVNPGYSEVAVEIYNPCAPNSRLGIPREQFEGQDLAGIRGLHFHCLCEQGTDTLERTLKVFIDKFSIFFDRISWVNFGGGHHITRPGYDVAGLIELVRDFRRRFGLDVILEPGEAIALNTGVLVATVLDVIKSGMDIAILDTSATAHMPDVLEMPYRPQIVGAGKPGEHPYTYRLGGLTCLAGDVIGDYSFAQPLAVGSKIVFLDMAHYTMVKSTTFNGMRLPSIAVREEDGGLRIIRRFGYEDYAGRLS
jgi:carboxynorspermidine decarboxylase